jgi:dihydropteroate synthase
VAREGVRAGAAIINDVSAGAYDMAIWEVAAENDLPYILMHGHDPRNRIPAEEIAYDDVVEDVHTFLRDRIAAVRGAGVRRVAADVGIGFAKRAEESARLLREGRRFLDLGVPMLVGASRKAFIGRILGGLPPEKRLYGTLGAHLVAAMNGAAIVRVHDVRPAREFFAVVEHLTVAPSAGNHC